MANGENHDSEGLTEPAGPVTAALMSAHTAKIARITTSALSSQRCVRALSSMPM